MLGGLGCRVKGLGLNPADLRDVAAAAKDAADWLGLSVGLSFSFRTASARAARAFTSVGLPLCLGLGLGGCREKV